jgi:hypothetical protein
LLRLMALEVLPSRCASSRIVEKPESRLAFCGTQLVKRIAPVQIISFFVLSACGAWCQSARPSVDLLQEKGSNSPEVRPQERRTWRFLPDAPSGQPATQTDRFHPFVHEARSPSILGAVGINAGIVREAEPGGVSPRPRNLTASYEAAFAPSNSSIFDKYLYPSLGKRILRYHPSTSGSFMGRATYAASRIFITHDDSGKGKLNTSYFLGMLTSVTVESAYRPYWARSTSATFNNVGSTIGSDAGINLLHEFGPGIRQILRGHGPKFVSSLADRIPH